MDARLNLDCEESLPGRWRVWCRNTGIVLAAREPSAEHAWATAAEKLAQHISEIRRTVCDLEG